MKRIYLFLLISFSFIGCNDSNEENNEIIVSQEQETNLDSLKEVNGPVIKSFVYHVNLSEIENENSLLDYFKIDSIHKEKNEIFLKENIFGNYLYRFIHTGILNNNIKQFDFYQEKSYPKLSYWEYIINQLPSFTNYGYKYDSYSDEFSEGGKLFAFLSYRMDRSPENIEKLFSTYEELIYSEIDAFQYEKRELETYVQYLITTYDYISSLDDYQSLLTNIGKEIQLADQDETIFNRSKQEEIYEPIYTPWKVNNHPDALWFFSFWLRRFQEGNMPEVYAILKKIDAHYYNFKEDESNSPEIDDDIIYTGSGNWKKIENCELPENVVVGGFDQNKKLIVCRTEYAGGIHPGKLVDCSCEVGYGDLQVSSENYEVLTGNEDFRWEEVVNCELPEGAIRGGIENERYLVICRANYKGGLHPGKVVDCNCNIAFEGKEIQVPDYEVLVKR